MVKHPGGLTGLHHDFFQHRIFLKRYSRIFTLFLDFFWWGMMTMNANEVAFQKGSQIRCNLAGYFCPLSVVLPHPPCAMPCWLPLRRCMPGGDA